MVPLIMLLFLVKKSQILKIYSTIYYFSPFSPANSNVIKNFQLLNLIIEGFGEKLVTITVTPRLSILKNPV